MIEQLEQVQINAFPASSGNKSELPDKQGVYPTCEQQFP
jgi:hypothetical protein